MILSAFTKGGKSPFPRTASALPIRTISADATWNGKTLYENLKFYNFKTAKSDCDSSRSVFVMNPTNADYIPQHHFKNTEFHDVHPDAYAKFMDPPIGWASISDCGNFPCTAPLNAALYLTGSKIFKSENTFPEPWFAPSLLTSTFSFQMMGNNSKVADGFPTCKYN